MKEFTKKIESWNRQYKARKEAKAEEAARKKEAKADEESMKSKKSFSQQVCEWNQHYKKEQKRYQEQAEDSHTEDNNVEEETAEVDITQRVTQWDQHYKSTGHPSTNQLLDEKHHKELNTINEDSIKLTDKVYQWETFYRSSGKRNRGEPKQSSINGRLRCTGDERMTELVHKWNRHYTVPRRRNKQEDMEPQYRRKTSVNRVTSLLVKKWDDHYDAVAKENIPPPTIRRTSLTEPRLASPESDKQPDFEKRKSSQATVKRTPSLVKARISEFATQSAAMTKMRQQRPMSCQQELARSQSVCRTRSNIAELKSKFSLARYDPKSFQQICS